MKVMEHGFNPNLETSFSNFAKLARFSMDCLIDMILKHESKPTKKDVIVFILCSDCLSFKHYRNNIDLDSNMEKPETGAPCLNIDLGEMLKQLPWLVLEPLLPNTREGISSQLEDFKYIIQSEKSFDNLELVYDACKITIVEEKVKFEGRTGKGQKDLKRDIEKAKEKLAQINERKGQLYALFRTKKRIYIIKKINIVYKFNNMMQCLFETLEQRCKDELEKLEHQLSQLSQICSFSSYTRFV